MFGGSDYTCPTCGAQGIDTWRFPHCWKCGHRETESADTSGTVFGGGTSDVEDGDGFGASSDRGGF